MADIEIQAEYVFAWIDTQITLAQRDKSCYDSEAIRGNMVQL
jgi:hypothetical protein